MRFGASAGPTSGGILRPSGRNIPIRSGRSYNLSPVASSSSRLIGARWPGAATWRSSHEGSISCIGGRESNLKVGSISATRRRRGQQQLTLGQLQLVCIPGEATKSASSKQVASGRRTAVANTFAPGSSLLIDFGQAENESVLKSQTSSQPNTSGEQYSRAGQVRFDQSAWQRIVVVVMMIVTVGQSQRRQPLERQPENGFWRMFAQALPSINQRAAFVGPHCSLLRVAGRHAQLEPMAPIRRPGLVYLSPGCLQVLIGGRSWQLPSRPNDTLGRRAERTRPGRKSLSDGQVHH